MMFLWRYSQTMTAFTIFWSKFTSSLKAEARLTMFGGLTMATALLLRIPFMLMLTPHFMFHVSVLPILSDATVPIAKNLKFISEERLMYRMLSLPMAMDLTTYYS